MNSIDQIDVSKLRVIDDEHDTLALPEGALFLAKFLHNPKGDDMWHAKQIMPDILAGRVVRRGLSVEFWQKYAELRPPICSKKTRGFDILG